MMAAKPQQVLLAHTVARLAREASIEINVQDAVHCRRAKLCWFPARNCLSVICRSRPGESTATMCREVHAAGFDSVPHIPVRLISDANMLDRMLDAFVTGAHVREVLLISGD